jgi:hypothetical protein
VRHIKTPGIKKHLDYIEMFFYLIQHDFTTIPGQFFTKYGDYDSFLGLFIAKSKERYMKTIFSKNSKILNALLILCALFSIFLVYSDKKEKEKNINLIALMNGCDRVKDKCYEMLIAFREECFDRKNGHACAQMSILPGKNVEVNFEGRKQDENSLCTLACAYGHEESCLSEYFFNTMDSAHQLEHRECRYNKRKCGNIKAFLEKECGKQMEGACYELATLMRKGYIQSVSIGESNITDPQQIFEGSCKRDHRLSCDKLKKQ